MSGSPKRTTCASAEAPPPLDSLRRTPGGPTLARLHEATIGDLVACLAPDDGFDSDNVAEHGLGALAEDLDVLGYAVHAGLDSGRIESTLARLSLRADVLRELSLRMSKLAGARS